MKTNKASQTRIKNRLLLSDSLHHLVIFPVSALTLWLGDRKAIQPVINLAPSIPEGSASGDCQEKT